MRPSPFEQDTPRQELYLLEHVAIECRKTELRQLLRLLNLVRTGQPKAALITGDTGIGKSALLDAFVTLARESAYCRVLNMGTASFDSVEAFYVAIIEALQAEADTILEEALVAVNRITSELDLRWEHSDLVRAVALVKLQESIGGKQAVSQDQLMKSIRSQVPAIRKLRPSVNESIEKLVDILVNPWVMAATSLLNPMTPPLQEAIKLAERLKSSGAPSRRALPTFPSSLTDPPTLSSPPPTTFPASGPLSSMDFASPERSDMAQFDPERSETDRDIPIIRITDPMSSETPAGTTVIPIASSEVSSVWVTELVTDSAESVRDPLLLRLLDVFHFLNTAIDPLDNALLIVLDEWERILDKPARQAIKAFLSEMLHRMTEQKQYHVMVVLTARSEDESYTLGGPLYQHFRTKLLLDALPDVACRKLLRNVLKSVGADADEEVHRQAIALSRGNPLQHLKLARYLAERVQSHRIRHVDMTFYGKLGVEKIGDVPELAFTRLKLAFLNDEDSLSKVIATLIRLFRERPFSAHRAVREISASQGLMEGYVFDVLRGLYRHDFIRDARETTRANASQASSSSSDLSGDPCYVIHSRPILAFLREKTRATETDISTDEKLAYLKRIIPLSVKAGELDREKTMEVLALGDAMGRPEVAQFLEETFLDGLKDDTPVVRVTALNNLALLDSRNAREALFRAMRDNDSMVREYAACNLALLSRKSGDDAPAGRIIDSMSQAVDDESEAVRAQAYGVLSRYKGHPDIPALFVKGVADACDAVRLISAQSLADLETDSPYVVGSLIDALDDPLLEVRRMACLGLRKHPVDAVIDALANTLWTDTDNGLRALAADVLSRMDHPGAFKIVADILRHVSGRHVSSGRRATSGPGISGSEIPEDVKLAAARAMGKCRCWETEELLLEVLQNTDPDTTPVLMWVCIRSLGETGGTEQSLSFLNELKTRLANSILVSAIDMAGRRIGERIDELRRMERRLEEATPPTVAMSGDDEEALPEEDVIPERCSS